jgi:hypothetical protein
MSTEPLFPRHLLSLVLLMTVAACAAMPSPPKASPDDPGQVTGGIETVQRILHPAGPTIRREWRQDQGSPVSRIQIANARSGQLLVGQTRLQRLPDGGWQITTGAGHVLRLATGSGAGSQAFAEGGRNWTLRVEKETLPILRPGVSTEGEPALDLLIEQSR